MSKSFNLGKIKGSDGKSAYDSAKEGGFTGTEEEFNKLFMKIYSFDIYPILENEVGVTNLKYEYGDARRYGAVGDGTTYDTTSLKNAISSTIAIGKNRIFVPEGNYRIGSKINISNSSHFEMYGAGQGKTIFKAIDGLTSGSDMFTFSKCTFTKFHDFTVDGNSTVNTDGTDQDGIHLFDLWNCENAEIYNVNFENNIYTGCRIANSKNITVHDCMCNNTDVAILTFGDTAENIKILSCQVNGHSKSEGISIYNKVKIKDIVIRDCIIENKESAMGICIGYQGDNTNIDAENIVIENCKITNVAVGISVDNPSGTSKNIIISKNVISTTTESTGGNAINIKNTINSKIVENIIEEAYLKGINAANSDNISIIDNTILNYDAKASDSSNCAITLSDSNDCIVQNNIIQQNLTDSNNGILVLNGTSKRNIFKDNKVLPSSTNTKSALINVSTNSAVEDNVISYDYDGILIGVSGLDYSKNKFVVNNYKYKLTNSFVFYNKPYLNDIVITINKDGITLNPNMTASYDGDLKRIKIVASNSFTLSNTTLLLWKEEKLFESGTYIIDLEFIDGKWIEMNNIKL